MESTSLLKFTGLVIITCGGIVGTAFATSLVTPQTTICVKANSSMIKEIVSLSITPSYNNKPIDQQLWTATEKNTCVVVYRDWIASATPGTSLFIKGVGKDGKTYLLENRDIAMFRTNPNMQDVKKIDLYYDVFGIYSSSSIKNYAGTVDREVHSYDKGSPDQFSLSGVYRSDLHDYDAFDVLRQIDATRYTKIADFKGKTTITREQAAKFFYATRTATHTDNELPTDAASRTKTCTFSDANKIDPTLKQAVLDACYLGLMKGSAGKFNPTDTITLAEVTAVLLRMKYGLLNEGSDPWYLYYFFKSYDVTLFDGFGYNPRLEDFNKPISREMIGFMIRRLLQMYNIPIKTYNTI